MHNACNYTAIYVSNKWKQYHIDTIIIYANIKTNNSREKLRAGFGQNCEMQMKIIRHHPIGATLE